MVFQTSIPTTSHLNLAAHFACPSHPSLPAAATACRNQVRAALKACRRDYGGGRGTGTGSPDGMRRLLVLLEEYVPYLLTVEAGLRGESRRGGGGEEEEEEVDVMLIQEVEVEWRAGLAASSPQAMVLAGRVRGRGLDYEIHCVLQAVAIVRGLLAREGLLKLWCVQPSASASDSVTHDRVSLIQSAIKHLLAAHAIHAHLLHLRRSGAGDDGDGGLGGPAGFPREAVDVHESAQTCLAELTLAEATLLFVLKDDPYPFLLQQSRDKNDREWMIKAPVVPRVRAHLFARLCLGAADHAGRAAAAARAGSAEGGKGLSKDLVRYCEDLRFVSRAKGCRFLGIDAEAGDKTGEAIAWLKGGMAELGMDIPKDVHGERMSFGKLKSSWAEKREDRKMEKGKTAEWGADAGKMQEGRVLEWLVKKWTKQNDTVNVQPVPDHAALVAGTMPSGREAFGSNPATWSPKLLGEEALAKMRAPVEAGHGPEDEPSSGDEVDDDPRTGSKASSAPAGAFPGTKGEYGGDGYY